jgi:GNAT superfamily N-acetyltransferase
VGDIDGFSLDRIISLQNIAASEKKTKDVSPMQLRLLQHHDLPGAMRLKEAAHWNQTKEDWERLLELEPDGCFVISQDNAVAASATAVVYGVDLAWIGMVLTLPEFRKRGFSARLMERVLEFAASSGAGKVALDATDMGFPIYRSFGFETESIVERWELPVNSAPVSPPAVNRWQPSPNLDLHAFGADRSRLLASLARVGAASAGEGEGYAMARPGSRAAYFGPCVAKSPEAAEDLLRWFLAQHSQEQLCWDIPLDNPKAVALAQRYGFQPMRRLRRMVRNLAAATSMNPTYSYVFAIAGFEYG